VLDEDPLTILDGAHNPHAVGELLRSLPDVVGGRPLALVLGVLEDKDAASMLAALLPHAERAWFVPPPSPRALPPDTLASLARQQGFEGIACEASVERALAQAREWARTALDASSGNPIRAGTGTSVRAGTGNRGGAVLVTGSVYLVGEVLAGGRTG
jgi:folylpolyglutamate synthase/dihydropteroate synthase